MMNLRTLSESLLPACFMTLALVAGVGSAIASPPKPKSPPQPKVPAPALTPTTPPEASPLAPPPPPGTCSYIQPQVKQCTVSPVGGVGTFDIVVAPPAGLVLNFEEPIAGMQPPPSTSYKAIFSGNTATVVPLRKDPIAGATVHFDTPTVHVTLNLILGPRADTQVLILDPRKAARDEEVERRVSEQLAGFEERSSERAERILLEEIASGGMDILDPDAGPARSNQVVLRAKKLLRIGGRRVLFFSVENRTSTDLEIRKVRLYTSDAKDRELSPAAYELAAKLIPVNEEVNGAVSVPLKSPAASDRLRLRVEMSDARRNVELGGIRVK